MLEHLADNGIPDKKYLAIQSPVSGAERDVFFTCGHATEWYGQTILPSADTSFGEWPDSSVKQKRTISIVRVLDQVGPLDSLHSDVQGEEEVIFPACTDLLNESVKRVHIGTHSRVIDAMLFKLSKHGWQNHFAFPCQTERVVTSYGLVDFQDGVQSWINPRL
jgi:hypothetical protein